MRGKRRSDIQKLVTAARDIWRQSENYQTAKKLCRNETKSGWFTCSSCKSIREVIQIDHVIPIGKQPELFSEFGFWLDRLFNFPQKGICKDCHKAKTKEENKKRAEEKKRLKAEQKKMRLAS